MRKKIIFYNDDIHFEISRSNGFIVKSFDFESPKFDISSEKIGNVDGECVTGITFSTRTGKIEFYAKCADFTDTFLRDHELRSIFLQKKSFFVTRDVIQHNSIECYVNNYKVERLQKRLLLITVDLIAPYPYFRSRATSTEQKTFDADAWQFGQNLQLDDVSYTHKTKSFAIYNASDITIDPRTHYLQATFVIKEAASFFRITNRTTNEIVVINRAVAVNDVVMLDGVNVYLNGQNIIADTNLELLTLTVGMNAIELSSLADSTFDFYFYYI